MFNCFKLIEILYSLFEAASNFSDFFFRFHFQGLNNLPKAWSLDFLWIGGVAEPKLLLLGTPFAFFPKSKMNQWIWTSTCYISIRTVITTNQNIYKQLPCIRQMVKIFLSTRLQSALPQPLIIRLHSFMLFFKFTFWR